MGKPFWLLFWPLVLILLAVGFPEDRTVLSFAGHLNAPRKLLLSPDYSWWMWRHLLLIVLNAQNALKGKLTGHFEAPYCFAAPLNTTA